MIYYDTDSYRYANEIYNSKQFSWDYVLVTASNEKQKQYYEEQLKLRKIDNFAVIPDREDRRSGSGGASLSCIKCIWDKYKCFDKKVLVIHSGGDSKRIPQFSAVGKLFSPMPHCIKGNYLTLFDELMVIYAPLSLKIDSGFIFSSGDVLPLIKYDEISIEGDACAISFAENAENATHHGVFVFDSNNILIDSLQKRSLSELNEKNAIHNGKAYIDTGIVYYSKEVVKALYSLVDTNEKYQNIVNENIQLSLYVDFVYPFIKNTKLNSYLSEPGNLPITETILELRNNIFNVLSKYSMYVAHSDNSRFIHIGTTNQFLDFIINGRNSIKNCSNVVNCKVNKNTYLEFSSIYNCTIGENSIVSYADIDGVVVPHNVVINVVKLLNGNYVARIYGINDNPKNNFIFGHRLNCSLWDANLFQECQTSCEAVKSSLALYRSITEGSYNVNEINAISLKTSFEKCDYTFVLNQKKYIINLKSLKKLILDIKNKVDVSNKKYSFVFPFSSLEHDWIARNLGDENQLLKLALMNKIGNLSHDDIMIKNAFLEFQNKILISINTEEKVCITTNRVCLSSPLRVNFAGGWTDTPPICFKLGGSVLNASIILNNENPVKVEIEKIKQNSIILECKDLCAYKEFTCLKDLQITSDPSDPFALEKAALIATGIIPRKNGTFSDVFSKIGSGFKISSYVVGVPKGSGLGTSSILSFTVIKALSLYFGFNYDDMSLCQRVMFVEQLMTTGGGWQDQVGGAFKGFKLITSDKGFSQELNIDIIKVSKEMKEKLNKKLCLIYTGQQRLARNLLRKVISNYLDNKTETIIALKSIKKSSKEMAKSLSENDYYQFVRLYNRQLKYSVNIYNGTINKRIELLLKMLKPYCDASMIAGAGGGGFIVSFMKENVSIEDIKKLFKRYKTVKVYTASFVD